MGSEMCIRDRSGERVLLGVPADVPGPFATGAAFVYEPVALAWVQQAAINHSSAASSDFFGQSVALAGDTALVGMPLSIFCPSPFLCVNPEAAFVFERGGGGWVQTAMLVPGDASPPPSSKGDVGDQFGLAVDLTLAADRALAAQPLAEVAAGRPAFPPLPHGPQAPPAAGDAA